MKIYLINQYDSYCPENNNGDYFISAWSTREMAEAEIKRLRIQRDKSHPSGYLWRSNEWVVCEFVLDKSSV